jgi:peptidoglycan glycosyltransferase
VRLVSSPLSSRRRAELGLGLLSVVAIVFGYALLGFANRPDIPADLYGVMAAVVGLFVVAHLAVRRFSPQADPTLLPMVMMLNGIGFIVIARLDPTLARTQAIWTGVAVAGFVTTLIVVRRVRSLERYRYTFLLVGLVTLVLPLAPGIGRQVNGSRLWVRIGPVNFQPGEAAKVVLVVFFAAYLIDKRELLASGTRRLGRLRLPEPKHLGPLVVPWLASILVMVQEKDLGSSLLFFAVFIAMLYIATSRGFYLLAGGVLFLGGAIAGYELFTHVHTRVAVWIDPWSSAQGSGYQLVQSLYSFGAGGFAGTGLGLGHPTLIPAASTDFIFAVVGEELGLLGTVAILIAFLLIVGSAYRIALHARGPFDQLLAAGFATILGLQTFVIIGGVTRVIPLTGVTLPFVSYGGSSLVTNYILIALLLRTSHESATTHHEATRHATTSV